MAPVPALFASFDHNIICWLPRKILRLEILAFYYACIFHSEMEILYKKIFIRTILILDILQTQIFTTIKI